MDGLNVGIVEGILLGNIEGLIEGTEVGIAIQIKDNVPTQTGADGTVTVTPFTICPAGHEYITVPAAVSVPADEQLASWFPITDTEVSAQYEVIDAIIFWPLK